ncbi:MAG: ATP-dependent 6-phosphofructokinase, partial [Gemmatimonadaceae bacterium]|nr:ATP-dependent 6-phosphofructokinase [Gemmatimonadaceae bacterium]
MRIAISTGGGDAPGLNAVIRATVLSAIDRGWHVLGIKRGYMGLLGEDEVVPLTRDDVRGIAHLGGTILRTTNRGNPFSYPVKQPDGSFVDVDRSDELIENARNLGIEAFVTIGGDGSLRIAQRLFEKGVRIVGVPKTIDNDVSGTVTTFGFDTAVSTAIEAIDKLHTTAQSHDRVLVMEVMGRDSGFIALHSGVAGNAHVILIPEIDWSLDKVCASIMERDEMGKKFAIVVVAEGARFEGEVGVLGESLPGQAVRVGGVAERIARAIQARTGKECRSLVLGHLQRGGMPTG